MAVDHLIKIIQPVSGIQRDGTQYDSVNYIDGQWVRFYKGKPKKILGYVLINPGNTEIIRNIYVIDKQNTVDTYLGRPSTISFTSINLSGISDPEIDRTPSNFVADDDNVWTFDQYNNPALSTTIDLANNPLTSTASSGVVKVLVPDSSIFTNGQNITIAGAAAFDSLTAPQLNISAPLTIFDGTHITYPTAGSAGSGATGGGNAVTLTYTSSVTYLIAHAAPNASDINNNVQTNIYWGDINSNAALTLMDSVNLPISSGGIIVNYPYVFIYGNNGEVSYILTPNDWSSAVSVAIANSKIVKAIKTRGGSNTPAILFFAMNSVVRATFQGGNPAFAFDTIQEDTTIMAQNCVVSDFNVAYWIGVDQFYLYNGVVRPLENDMNTDYFFDNLNYQYRNKVFGWLNKRNKEIWWHWPKGDATECTDVIIYNYKENRWYDTILARSAAFPPRLFRKPLLADSNAILNKFNPITTVTFAVPTDALATTSGIATITVTLDTVTDLRSGNIVTISGATAFGGLTIGQLNVTSPIVVTSFPNLPTVFTYTAGANAGSTVSSGGGNAIFYSQQVDNDCYGLWKHETGNNMVLFGSSLAIQSYYETNIFTLFDDNPSTDYTLRVRRIEPDFVQQGNMNLTINFRSFPQSITNTSQVYTFLPGPVEPDLAKIDTVQMGRFVSFRFESNEVDGFYFAGKILLSYAPGDVRP